MSSPQQSTPALAPAAALTREWLDLWRHAAALGQGSVEGVAAFWDFRRLRTLWFAELGRATDRYLKSPAFVELMRVQLGTMIRSTHLGAPFPLR